MAIVASEAGGLVPCIGGDHRLPYGRNAVKAFTWDDVRQIVSRFGRLNPYDPSVVKDSILKIEDLNFDEQGRQRQVYGFAIASKRYALWENSADDNPNLVKVSGHGLGYLFPPTKGFDEELQEPTWVAQAWDWIVRGVLGVPRGENSWFSRPAMMRFTITTPAVFRALQVHQKEQPYADQIKPFNFILSPVIERLTGGVPIGADPDHFTLIAPFRSDPNAWYRLQWINVHDGKVFRLGQPGKRLSYEVAPKTYGSVIRDYHQHAEAKSLAPDETACLAHTSGLLLRTPVTAAEEFSFIGKETDRRWEREEDFSLLAPQLQVYRPNETAQLVADPVLREKVRRVSRRKLAKAAGVSERTVKAARRGKRLRKSTARKLATALKNLPSRR